MGRERNMASEPFHARYTPHELETSRQIAAALWLLTAFLSATLAVWSAGPVWIR